jgi:hypothetical protein
MRALLSLAPLFLLACRAAPMMEPVGGFTLGVGETREWREATVAEFEGWMGAAESAVAGLADYRATLESSERIGDELFPRRVMTVWVLAEPLRVAIVTLEPESERGQRVWYDGEERELVAETPGFLGALVGRVGLDPEGELAMKNRRHPVSDVGLARMVEQMREAMEPLLALSFPTRIRAGEARLAERDVRLVEVLQPAVEADEGPVVHRFAFDRESGLVTYYGLAELGSEGVAVLEEYLYRDLATNLGLGVDDFAPGQTPGESGTDG